MTKQKYAMAAVLFSAILLLSMPYSSFAEKPEKPKDPYSNPDGEGKLVPVPGKGGKKGEVSAQGTRQKTFSWVDCAFITRSGDFWTWLENYPTDQVSYKWSWPSITKGGWACTDTGFDWMFQQLRDVTQNWTVYSGYEYNNVRSTWKTYNIVDTSGNPMYVNYLDTVNSQENACYNFVNGICYDQKYFSTGDYTAV